MIEWGINALNHGSSLAVFKDGEYIDNVVSTNNQLTPEMYKNFLEYQGTPDRIYWYEKPWLKKLRQVYAGQYTTALDMSVLPKCKLKEWGLGYAPITYTPHHGSHAAAGYYTSPFNHCAIVVLDAIGEFECATIWEAKYGEMRKVWSRRYPNSLGLFYSAFTDLIGLTPIKEEYILQRLAATGNPKKYHNNIKTYINGTLDLKKNLHKGVLDWPYSIDQWNNDRADIAAAVQQVFEEQVYAVMKTAKELINTDCLVYMGGCAMNSTANKKVVEPMFNRIWSLSNPGDASSALGAVMYHSKHRVKKEWDTVKHIEIKI